MKRFNMEKFDLSELDSYALNELQQIFNREIVRELLRENTDAEVTDDLVYSIYGKCGGNPFNAMTIYALDNSNKMD